MFQPSPAPRKNSINISHCEGNSLWKCVSRFAWQRVWWPQGPLEPTCILPSSIVGKGKLGDVNFWPSPLNVSYFSRSSSHVEAQLFFREFLFSWWNLVTQGLALILEQNVSAPKTMILGFNISSITAFLKRQLYSERWRSSTFLSLCCFTLLQRYLSRVPLGMPKLPVLCFEQPSLLVFSNLSWKAFVIIHHSLSPQKLNFTSSSNILKQAYGHQVYFDLLQNVSICPVINNPCDHLRKRCWFYHSFVMHHVCPLMCKCSSGNNKQCNQLLILFLLLRFVCPISF